MRMMKRRLESVTLYKPQEQKSSYVGTQTVWVSAGTVLADIQPGEDTYLREEYGERAQDMFLLYMEAGIDIQKGYGAFSLGKNQSPTYQIKSVKAYKTGHIVAVAEREAHADE